jgi:hypothetical protein
MLHNNMQDERHMQLVFGMTYKSHGYHYYAIQIITSPVRTQIEQPIQLEFWLFILISGTGSQQPDTANK